MPDPALAASMRALRYLLAIAIAGELALVAYLALVAWVTSAWFIDDSLAFRLDASGWWWIAARRVCVWAGVSVIVGFLVLLINRTFLAKIGFPRLAANVSGALAGAAPLLASVAGAVRFGYERPFM
jgi:hypothetical protein